jgi:hypothetical protein
VLRAASQTVRILKNAVRLFEVYRVCHIGITAHRNTCFGALLLTFSAPVLIADNWSFGQCHTMLIAGRSARRVGAQTGEDKILSSPQKPDDSAAC